MTIRKWDRSGLDAIHVLLSDWNVVRYMLLPHCHSLEETRRYLDQLIGPDPGAAWRSLSFAIHLPGPDHVIGMCGIASLHGSEQGEIWYLVRPDFWGRGIARAAACRLLRIGFIEMGLHRIFAACLPENQASQRVLERIGMRQECRQVKSLKIHGVWRDCLVYALLRDEWEAGLSEQPLLYSLRAGGG